jgi:signal transduction histidine kinase
MRMRAALGAPGWARILQGLLLASFITAMALPALVAGREIWHLYGIVGVVVVQALLITGLILQRLRRRRAEAALAERLRFETLLSEISSGLINVPAAEVEPAIARALERIIAFLAIERGGLHLYEGDRLSRRIVSWAGSGPPPRFVEYSGYPWAIERLMRGEIVRFSRLDELPAEAAIDRETFATVGAQSFVGMGLWVGGAMVGILSFGSTQPGWVCSDDLAERLRLLGEMLAGAMVRRQTALALEERLRFETLVSEISSGLMNVHPTRAEPPLLHALERLVTFLGILRGGVYLWEGDRPIHRVFWAADGVGPTPNLLHEDRFPWVLGQIRHGETVRFSRLDELPLEASIDRESFERRGTQSHMSIGLRVGGSIVGILALGSSRPGWVCSDQLVDRLHLLGQIFASALVRRRAALALDERLRFERLATDLSARFSTVAMADVDREIHEALGRIVEFLGVDRSLMVELASDRRGGRITHSWTTDDTQPIPQLVPNDEFPWSAARLGRGEAVRFSTLDELPPEAKTDVQSFARYGVRSQLAIPMAIGGKSIGLVTFTTVVGHREWPDDLVHRLRLLGEVFANALARRRAETAIRENEEMVRRQREELAFMLRVTTVSELAMSIAHEVNQPLAAIVTSAQAVARMLEREDRSESRVKEALTHIAEDAKRASEVIRRVRMLFQKEHAERKPLDLDALVIEAMDLVRHDIEQKGVSVEFRLGQWLPPVPGDAVQLQQVVLNVVLNATESMASSGTKPRQLTIETSRPRPGAVELAVSDTGVGVDESKLEQIFDRFFTTKAMGLGMGLAICRSIVEDHGGRIWAARNVARGITVRVELPCEEQSTAP